MTNVEAVECLLGTGLLERLRPVAQMTDEPRVFAYQAPLSETGKSHLVAGDSALGQGTDFDVAAARVKAAAETLERLCLRAGPIEELTLAPFHEVAGAIDPADFLCYSDDQVGGRERRADQLRAAPRLWTPARELLSGRDCLVPAELVWLGVEQTEGSIRVESNSNGAAFGEYNPDGLGRAAVSGLLELVERDAFVGWWHGCVRARRVTACSRRVEQLLEDLRRYRLETVLLDLTSDLQFPVAAALTLDRTGAGPGVTCGAAARPNWNDADHHAVLESIGYRGPVRLDWARRSPDPTAPLDGLDARIWHWYPTERIADLEDLLEGLEGVSRTTEDPCSSIDGLRELLTAKGWRWICADMTLPEIQTAGFEALRIMVPELHPVYFKDNMQALWSQHYGGVSPSRLPHPLA